MKEIPVEAKIVAVADVFDALSSHRPYKRPWTFTEIASELHQEVIKNRLDSYCVNALLANRMDLDLINHQFKDV